MQVGLTVWTHFSVPFLLSLVLSSDCRANSLPPSWRSPSRPLIHGQRRKEVQTHSSWRLTANIAFRNQFRPRRTTPDETDERASRVRSQEQQCSAARTEYVALAVAAAVFRTFRLLRPTGSAITKSARRASERPATHSLIGQRVDRSGAVGHRYRRCVAKEGGLARSLARVEEEGAHKIIKTHAHCTDRRLQFPL